MIYFSFFNRLPCRNSIIHYAFIVYAFIFAVSFMRVNDENYIIIII